MGFLVRRQVQNESVYCLDLQWGRASPSAPNSSPSCASRVACASASPPLLIEVSYKHAWCARCVGEMHYISSLYCRNISYDA